MNRTLLDSTVVGSEMGKKKKVVVREDQYLATLVRSSPLTFRLDKDMKRDIRFEVVDRLNGEVSEKHEQIGKARKKVIRAAFLAATEARGLDVPQYIKIAQDRSLDKARRVNAERHKARLERIERERAGILTNPGWTLTDEPPADLRAFYKTPNWQYLRFAALAASEQTCMACGAGKKARLVVDHIKPVRSHFHLRLDPGNVQVLCNSCNWGKGVKVADFRPDWYTAELVDSHLKV